MGGPGCVVVLRSGADVLYTMTDGYISRRGQLSTGDKMQGSIQYTITSANDDISGLSI